ncbi:MAG: hypothetical protein IJU67_03930 [Lachnospiraceae bacterium]|nr:hypothetical protein [Lachnospiraceae bacterium]
MQDKGPTKKRLLAFRIIAVVAAVLVWIMIKNTDDPVTSRRISGIPITFENTEVFTDNGLSYEVQGGVTTATVIAYARSSRISDITADDFRASVDFNMITDINGAVPVDVVYIGDEHALEDYTIVTTTLRITSESITTQAMNVRVTTDGALADGLSVGQIVIDPPTVYVSGPVSILNSIYSVGSIVDVSGAVDRVEQDILLKFYDIRGQQIDLGEYADEITVTDGTDEVDTVHVRIEILSAVGAALDIRVAGTDAVAEGFRYRGVSASRDSVVLMGSAEAVEGMRTIVVDGPELDVTGANADVVCQIDLSEYLPEGVRIDGDPTVTVTMNIEELVTNGFDVRASEVALTGEDAAYEYTVTGGAVLRLTGIADDLSGIEVAGLSPRADVSGLEEGDHEVELSLTLPEGVENAEPAYVTVRVTERESVPENAQGSSDEVPGTGE